MQFFSHWILLKQGFNRGKAGWLLAASGDSIPVLLLHFSVQLPVVQLNCIIKIILKYTPLSLFIAALFFFSYECLKRVIGSDRLNPVTLSISSSISEVAACTVRVPVEVIKQRMQVGIYKNMNVVSVAYKILKTEGGFGLYRGFAATIQREIPFAAIQFPIYEGLKKKFARDDRKRMALCGSVAGGITALFTTPLDVLKTRTMLNTLDNPSLKKLWQEGKIRSLFAGAVPRVTWVSLGGFVFFGVYEKIIQLTSEHDCNKT